MNDLRVVISGGGTGGHIFPAIAIANAIKIRYPSAKILFIGAIGRMEMTKVPAAGYQIEGLDIQGLDRQHIYKNIVVLWKYLKSLKKARRLLKRFRPHIVIGVGGYASAPTLREALSLSIPTLLQEQNSYAGVTNKYLSKKAKKICVAYEGMERFFPKEKIVLTGNPVRQDLENAKVTKAEAREHFGLKPDIKTILIVGGSLGSRTINKSVLNHIGEMKNDDIQILWQCGGHYLAQMSVQLAENEDKGRICIYDFINRMDMAYKAADLVVSRAGAGAISELCLLGKPTVLVPSPNVSEDHQTKNAEALVNKNAAVMIKDADADATLLQTAIKLVQDDNQLEMLSENIFKLAQHNSADRIVDEIVKIIKAK